MRDDAHVAGAGEARGHGAHAVLEVEQMQLTLPLAGDASQPFGGRSLVDADLRDDARAGALHHGDRLLVRAGDVEYLGHLMGGRRVVRHRAESRSRSQICAIQRRWCGA